ncbi:MAG: WD40/YVTN/BNR-like repeat-containing protein [Saprospiraceae bacterium]
MKLKFMLVLLPVFLLMACRKDTIDLTWKEQVTPTNLDLSAVHFTDTQTGHIVGGDSWYTGIYLQTTDAGKTWTKDTLTDKLLLGLHFDQEQRGYTVGIDGYFFNKEVSTVSAEWDFHRLPMYDSHRGVSFYSADKGVIVSGGAYQNGKVFRLNENYEVIAQDSFLQELSAVCFSSENIVHAVGYGIVIRSTDGGMTWKVNGIDGDFFQAIHFPSTQTGYAVGNSGMIIKTVDEGRTWKKIRSSNAVFGAVTALRAVYFVNEVTGYAVGDRGAFLRTTNGGKDWAQVEGFPKVDLRDIFVISGKGYLVGAGGQIFSFDE